MYKERVWTAPFEKTWGEEKFVETQTFQLQGIYALEQGQEATTNF